ncbi:MAG: NAD(P)-dependent alcohol dehydrogenase [Gammaproteobacteria bacterium]|nr:NAD(P)-dependent alcohol dehydrogenase [Gammaproteobacteria bacterium]NNC97075.1 NAD(P)-dependent alcohol dehydrogenase [Gammaproteobacteria bacterium]NNM14062.1 NAD(P)-dependent alcohol dehydrogenase [Gammaproteobacteria bacterium]
MIKAYAANQAGGKLEPFEYDPGELGQDDVEVKVEYCGICHSDLSMLNNDWGITQFPFVPGHEVVGTISQVGSNVSSRKVGQRVGIGWHAGYCLSCKQCMQGDHNLCRQAQGIIIGRHGGFADKVRVQAASAIVLPDDLDVESAGPLFCGGITVFTPIHDYELKPTGKVGVIGIGGLGHMALGFLNKWGCEVTAFTSSEDKMQQALELGAHKTINSRDPEAIKAARGQFDLIISTVNVTLDWNLYISTLTTKGRLHFVGAVQEPLAITAGSLMNAQKSVSSSPVGSPATIATMIEFAARHDIRPTVEVYPMEKVNEAMQHLADGKARYRVVLKM